MTTTSFVADSTVTSLVRPRSQRLSIKRLRSIVASVLVVCVVSAAGFVGDALVRGTWVVTPVLSGSMRPGLPVGGVVIGQRVPVDSLAVRDVIIFAEPGKPGTEIVHRIVQISESKSGNVLINTQGDTNTIRDPWTLSILGDTAYRARWSLPLVGYAAIYYQNNRGLVLFGLGLFLIITTLGMTLSRRAHDPKRRAIRDSTTDK